MPPRFSQATSYALAAGTVMSARAAITTVEPQAR